MRWIIGIVGVFILLGIIGWIIDSVKGGSGGSDRLDVTDIDDFMLPSPASSDWQQPTSDAPSFNDAPTGTTSLDEALDSYPVKNEAFVREVMAALGITRFSVYRDNYIRGLRSGQNALIYQSGRIADLSESDMYRVQQYVSRGSWDQKKDGTWRVIP